MATHPRIAPAPREIWSCLWARMPRARGDRHPPCDTPNCGVKRALFTLESYMDEDYIRAIIAQGSDPKENWKDTVEHMLADYARFEGKPHCFKRINICYSCLTQRIEGTTGGQYKAEVVNQMRDAQGSESILIYSRYLVVPAHFLRFCHAPDIEGCIKEANAAAEE